jgi:ADP-heptose:LPS heptosyltransferase
VKEILVMRFSAIGDILLTTPLLTALKAQYPRSEAHLSRQGAAQSVYLCLPAG